MSRKATVRVALRAAPVALVFALLNSCVGTPTDTGDGTDSGTSGTGTGATSGTGGVPSGGTGGNVATGGAAGSFVGGSAGVGGTPLGGMSGLGGAAGAGAAGGGGNGGLGGVSGGVGGGGVGGAGIAGGGAGGAGVAGGGAGGAGVAGGGAGGAGVAGGGAGGAGAGGAGAGGKGGAGGAAGGKGGTGGTSGTGGGGAGGGGGKGVEDDGTTCQVPALPAASGLPTVTLLPDPFKKLDGTRITARADWRCRRAEIKKQAETYAYGTKPPRPATVSGTVSNTMISVNVSDMGRSASFSASVTLPSGTGPFPVVVMLGSSADAGTIRGEGVATISYDPYSLGREGTGRANKQGAFYTLYGSNSTTGLLVAWAWGVSRIIDVIEMSGGNILRADAVGVTGCSRFGKGAFTVGVFDQRIALTMPVESGTAGVPIWRGVPGEGAQSLSSAYGEQPWFGDAFTSFTSAPTRAPLDTHELVAMVAPRGLFIMDNPHIANLGPRSAHVAALAGAEVYRALGAGSNISYISNVQSGTHCSSRPEWITPLRNNLNWFLKKTGTPAGTISAHANATGQLSSWRDWTTPTLQ